MTSVDITVDVTEGGGITANVIQGVAITGQVAVGAKGDKGDQGDPGTNGQGVPAGGSTGEILKKASNDDYDTEWGPDEGGDVESVNAQTGVVVLDADDIDDTSTTHKFTDAASISKLAGIEAGADVTDATNVNAAGATMNNDTSLAGNGYFLDEDNMASDDATKVPSQQSVKAYVDAHPGDVTQAEFDALEDKTVPEPGGILQRDPNMTALYDDLQDPSEIIDIVICGDSITEFGWVERLETQLAAIYNSANSSLAKTPTNGYRKAIPGGSLRGFSGTVQGTVTADGLAGYGTNLTNGQTASDTVNCDGIVVVWAEGTGSIQVRDGGAGGTLVATIDTSLGSGKSNLTSIDLTTMASREIHYTSVGNTQLEGHYLTKSNRTAGVRVWGVGHAGYSTQYYVDNPNIYLPFIANLATLTGKQPHVILASGFNDVLANYKDLMSDLIDSVRTETTGSVAVWANWTSGTEGLSNSYAARELVTEKNVGLIDAGQMFGDISSLSDPNLMSGDGAHPDVNGVAAIAAAVQGFITGNPIGTAMVLPFTEYTHLGGVRQYGATAGLLQVGQFFGYPVFTLADSTATGEVSSIQFYPGPLAALLGFSAAAFGMGVGGTTNADVHFSRTGVRQMTLFGENGTVLADFITNRIRQNAGTPESSVSAPVGAICHDTTNGDLYVKETGTGNTGWKLLAKVEDVTAAISDTAYANSWNGVTTVAPSKNAVYDALNTNGKGFVNHGSTAGTARPEGFASVEWYGTVEPSNMITGDTWINPS